MTTKIKAWQIDGDSLTDVSSSLAEHNRLEAEHLESWIEDNPELVADDLVIIGNQVSTDSGPMDFLAVDRSGDLIVVELKRGRLPRKVLAQAIDYASDVSSWDLDQLDEVCKEYREEPLEDFLNEHEKFEHVDIEELVFNKEQKLLLVGFSVDESLQRMIEWLSQNYGVSINAAILSYINTKGGEEILTRTKIISEEEEEKRSRKSSFQIEMSDEPASLEKDELRTQLENYLTEDRKTPKRIRDILLPLCLEEDVVNREMIKEKLVQHGEAENEGKAGIILTTISREIGIKKRDWLRQIIHYEHPEHSWEKDNYQIREGYEELVREVLGDTNDQSEAE